MLHLALTVVASPLDWVDALLDWLETFSSDPWFYVVIFAIALLDSVIPVVPSETTVILGGIAAGQGALSIPLVIAVGAVGAYVGDSIAYLIGNRAGHLLTSWFFRGEKGEDRLRRAGDQIRKRGGLLLITARFIPGGRTALTFSCGLTGQPFLAWFTRWDLVAVTVWSSYAGLLGYFFGERFEDDHSRAFWWAFGTALSVTAVIEVVRWLRERFTGRDIADEREVAVGDVGRRDAVVGEGHEGEMPVGDGDEPDVALGEVAGGEGAVGDTDGRTAAVERD